MFYVNPEPTKNFNKPHFYLTSSTWDDFSYTTSFRLYHVSEKATSYIGPVKIGHKTEKATLAIIPSEFESLSNEFFSLGQEMMYYENLQSDFPNDFTSILDRLNDAAFFSEIRDQYENMRVFYDSLIRSSEAEKALNEAKRILSGIPIEKAFKFTYNCKLLGASDYHTVNFNFGDSDKLPSRIIALVGKNGTGKTQFLAKLAVDLGGTSEDTRNEITFTPHRPLFSKIIAVSYSAFDKFSRPPKDKSISYKYCGLRNENGIISSEKMIENFKDSATKIDELNRGKSWVDVLSTILGKDVTQFFYNEIFEKRNYEVVTQDSSNQLSSGQSFLMYVITEVIANIRKDSLLLFDEPEMHLHPNAIANLTRMIDKLLDDYESYAVLATHSPIIIQEIASRYVYVFERQGTVPIVRNLFLESFGENIEILTQEVFQTKDVKDTYKEVLKELSKTYPYKMVLEFFDGKLSLNAKTYLLSQYNDKNEEFS